MIIVIYQQHVSGDSYIQVIQESVLVRMKEIYSQSLHGHIVHGLHKVWKYTQTPFSIINIAIKERRRNSTSLLQTNFTLTAYQF